MPKQDRRANAGRKVLLEDLVPVHAGGQALAHRLRAVWAQVLDLAQ